MRLYSHLLVITGLVLAPFSVADTSVWESAKESAYNVTGKVVSIAVSDEEILVRLASGNTRETYRICSSNLPGEGLSVVENERVNLIRNAFEHGDTIQVSYNGPFDRCIYKVEITKQVANNAKSL